MTRPSFPRTVIFALLISVFSALVAGAAVPVFAGLPIVRGLIALSGLAYLGFLLSHRRRGAGRPTAILIWFCGTAASWIVPLSIGECLAAQAAAIWVARSLISYHGFLPWVLDLAVSGLAFVAAWWAAYQTHSLGWMLWTFFLIQAMSCAVPGSFVSRDHRGGDEGEGFEQAYRNAELAVERLFSD